MVWNKCCLINAKMIQGRRFRNSPDVQVQIIYFVNQGKRLSYLYLEFKYEKPNKACSIFAEEIIKQDYLISNLKKCNLILVSIKNGMEI